MLRNNADARRCSYFELGLPVAACILINKVSDDACQWNGHDVVANERFVYCMTHEEKLSIQWPCSSDFHRFARDFCS